MKRTRRTKLTPNILLVDDDSIVRRSLGDVLATEGYTVLEAENGQQALEIAGATPVGLAVLDLNLPVKNGWDTFEELTREHPLMPIIIATARPNQLFAAFSAGAGALLEKPIEISTFLLTIRELLAEPTERRLARLIGKAAVFHFEAGFSVGGKIQSGQDQRAGSP